MVEFKRKILDNGLTLIHEKRDVPVTTVMMSVRFGAMYESKEEKGIAHFIEHLCFKGTEKRNANEISSSLEKVGGELNAFTHEEMTAYHVRLPSDKIELGIDVISDIFFNPIFPEEEIKKEGNVIVEEIKMYRDNPRMHVLENIKFNLFEEPYGLFTAGSEDTIKSMDRNQLISKHRENYIPKNSVLCVVGNNSFEEVERFAMKYANIERDGKILKDDLKIKQKIQKSDEKRNDLMQSNLAIGCHFPIKSEKDKCAAELFSSILGDGMSSKLFTEVREKRGLVYSVKSDIDLGRNYAYFIIWAGTEKSKVEEVIKISLEEYKKMENVSEEELKEAKEQVIGNHLVSSEASNETAIHLIMEEFDGGAENYYNFKENVDSVTLDDIKNLAKISDFSSFVLSS